MQFSISLVVYLAQFYLIKVYIKIKLKLKDLLAAGLKQYDNCFSPEELTTLTNWTQLF